MFGLVSIAYLDVLAFHTVIRRFIGLNDYVNQRIRLYGILPIYGSASKIGQFASFEIISRSEPIPQWLCVCLQVCGVRAPKRVCLRKKLLRPGRPIVLGVLGQWGNALERDEFHQILDAFRVGE